MLQWHLTFKDADYFKLLYYNCKTISAVMRVEQVFIRFPVIAFNDAAMVTSDCLKHILLAFHKLSSKCPANRCFVCDTLLWKLKLLFPDIYNAHIIEFRNRAKVRIMGVE